ncbi:MAG TPA: enoyl-CoA hydratase-related protein [Noviherbaspirillum sp.]|uniref:enoyl-CoA hydratase/isomerase family protein n=1 Tax=Noviherbaspirillum sp. TaxID=1926288 RepID=UPI002B4972EF|nr:enoyl-CoA hydratase-related protein [Noviherbaspirillum sp.]HJV86773.1 enoyl-CoA hydratase-related protein [Noviherbaspirillum sp.]
MSEIRIEKKDVVATIILSNPHKLNAIDVAMWKALAHAFTVLSQDESLRCVIVRGDEGNFAAGADVEEFSTVRNTMAQGIRYHTETIAQALHAVPQCQHPTIAAIEGVCVGGGLEIACACDLRIAAPSARFGIPINRLGFPLAPGELQSLLQLVGKAVVLEILLEGRVFDAAEAKDKGLIHRIASDVHAEAGKTASRIAQGAPLAARMNKRLVNRLAAQPEPLTEQELHDAFSFLASQDYREGVQTFLNKRKPVFSGK